MVTRNKKTKAGKEKRNKEAETAPLLREILAELRRLNENLERGSTATPATAAAAAAVATPAPAEVQQTAAADDYDDDDSDENSEDMDEFE
ncbi:MAG: hypothetical protein C4292_04210 [Nitrososphaera sp.]